MLELLGGWCAHGAVVEEKYFGFGAKGDLAVPRRWPLWIRLWVKKRSDGELTPVQRGRAAWMTPESAPVFRGVGRFVGASTLLANIAARGVPSGLWP